MTHARMRSELVSGRALCTARRMATIPYPASSAPSLALCARTVQRNAQSLPCLSRPSPSLLRLSGLRTPLTCPTSFALPVPSSLVPAGPRCMTLRWHAALCTFGGGLPCGSTPRRPALSSAPARCERLVRLWGTFLFLPHVRSYKPPWHTMRIHWSASSTPPSLPCYLCPSALQPARARCGSICEAALLLCPPSLPWPPSLVLPPFCSPSLNLPCPSSLVAGSLASCLSFPFLPLSPRRVPCRAMCDPPTPSLPCCPLAFWSPGKLHAFCTAHYASGGRPPSGCVITPHPDPPLAAGGQLGRGAPLLFLPLVRSL